MFARQTVFTDEARAVAVPDGDKRAKFLLVRAGQEIEPSQYSKFEGAAELIEPEKAPAKTKDADETPKKKH